MDHAGGSLDRAESHLAVASRLDPTNRSIQHTRANLARRQSLLAQNFSSRKQLRDLARSRLTGLTGSAANFPYGYHTAAQIALDELRDVLTEAKLKTADGVLDREIIDLTRDVEKHLNDGLQKFPINEHLLTLESEYRQVMEQDARAEGALKKAFAANPRLDWIAARLSRVLLARGDVEGAKSVLRKCVDENPSSKRAHFALKDQQGSRGLSKAFGASMERGTTKQVQPGQ